MSDKNKNPKGRRGLLADLLKGLVAAGAASVVPTSAKAVVTPEVIPTFDELRNKMLNDINNFTRQDSINIAMRMNQSKNAWKVLNTYSALQKRQTLLVLIHPLVVDKILFIYSVRRAQEKYPKDEAYAGRLVNIPYFDGKDSERYDMAD